MTHTIRVAALAAASIAASVAAASADGVAEVLDRFQPHRAVYDLSLERADATANVAGAAGRLVFEFTGSVCDGYAVNSRFVTRLQDQDGSERLTDLRSATFETLEPASFTFRNRTFINQVEQDETSGRATLADDGVQIDIDEPKRLMETLPAPAVFPTFHVGNLVRVALAGARIHEANVYDGADDGAKAFATTTVIGAQATGHGDPEAVEMLALSPMRDDLVHWRMHMSYFDLEGASGEVTPTYELSFVLYENGVSRDMTFDYGGFALTATLSDLELFDRQSCE